MNVVIWSRVSSREQREGYSIDAQLRANRSKAEREGWKVVREFVVAESAKRGAERAVFNEMFDWVRQNARKIGLNAILSHKLDRVCRNMRDAVRLQELEDKCGVRLTFVENQFGPGAAGQLSFNVMAAVAQYYSDNLRTEVLKGKDEKVLQGWLPCGAPFGYMNSDDRDEPIKLHPEQSRTVVRIFDLYSAGNMTFRSLSDRLQAEGLIFRVKQPKFNRTSLSYVLNNRFYLGEIVWHGKSYPGKHKPLIERHIFQICQDILNGKNRRKSGRSDAPLAGSLFRCAFCGQSITGERIRRKLRKGGVREHQYYRCANNAPGSNHPTVRWRGEDLEVAIIRDLESLRFSDKEQEEWFRTSLKDAVRDIESQQHRQRASIQKRQTELQGMQDRLLNAYLAGDVDADSFQKKSASLKTDLARCRDNLERCRDIDAARGDNAIRVFDWSQQAADLWRGSNNTERREILETICLNRTLSDVTLCTEKRRPFNVLAERPSCQSNRGERI
ncbi:MAG: recombinase family protein [Planctomycetes bacterium]|nr:recombinase family protein [Planctomycetota bacterium]